MTSLPTDTMLYIGTFMNPRDVVALTHVNCDLHDKSYQLLRNKFQETFGETNTIQQPDKKIMARLLCCAEQPNAAVNHNVYTTPGSYLERWKWIVGVENSLDKEVQENYNNNISLLEKTQATSIIQLKNQMKGFWHSDRQIKDYAKFKSDEKARATSGLISKLFFACLAVIFKHYYNPSILNIGKKLETRSRETFAQIGNFTLNSIDYNVVAFHVFADENSADRYRTYHDDTHRKFDSMFYGKTLIGIFEKQKPHSLEALGHHGPYQNFGVRLGREKLANRWGVDISTEDNMGFGKDAVLDSRRHLIIGSGLEFRDRTQDVQGSDRLLDQKLTQIMVEMTMQNKKIISLRVESNHDDLTVLTAGGFTCDRTHRTLEELTNFRSEEGNKLFPPYRDYGSHSTMFVKDTSKVKNVHYSKGAPEAWSDIIQREPILKSNSAILPEYWARKPNIIDESEVVAESDDTLLDDTDEVDFTQLLQC